MTRSAAERHRRSKPENGRDLLAGNGDLLRAAASRRCARSRRAGCLLLAEQPGRRVRFSASGLDRIDAFVDGHPAGSFAGSARRPRRRRALPARPASASKPRASRAMRCCSVAASPLKPSGGAGGEKIERRDGYGALPRSSRHH